jgi:hypothetical protein
VSTSFLKICKVHPDRLSKESNIPVHSARFRCKIADVVFHFGTLESNERLDVLRKFRVELDGGDTGETIATPEIGCHPAEGGKKKLVETCLIGIVPPFGLL